MFYFILFTIVIVGTKRAVALGFINIQDISPPIFRNMSTALNSASYGFVIMCQTWDTYAGDPRVRHALRLNKRRES
jgi:hypothetical protein